MQHFYVVDTASSFDAKTHCFHCFALLFLYFTAFGKPAGHRGVAPREFDVHSRWKPAREQKRKEGEE
jgi:hypothetical protein